MHPEVDRIRAKRAQSPWPKYLSSVQISGLRGWTGEEVRFEFPVTVICGENGCGKSTVLKAAAAVYRDPELPTRTYYPSKVFPDTPWDQVNNASLAYRIREGPNERQFRVSKRSERWRFQANKPKRHVIFQDVSRTLPIEATVGYAYIAKRTALEVSAKSLSPDLTLYFSSIMGRPYDSARFAISNVDAAREVGVVRNGILEYSQFHQGAGEDATLDLIALLQNVPDTALIILDEAEASLHPRAQRRLVHFLLWQARTKHLQVILSTHSPYVLEELPPEARIFLSRRNDGIDVLYGITPEFALNRMDDIDRPDLYLFTEDEESSTLVSALLRGAGVDVTRVSIVDVGPANVVNAVGVAATTPRFPVRAIGVVDADQVAQPGSIVFPGTGSPELSVFSDIRAGAVSALAGRLTLSEGALSTSLDQAMSAVDSHDWPSQLARLAGQTPAFLWETMCQVWVKECVSPSQLEQFVEPIRRLLP